ncbi:HNH endonuclease [Rhodopirellula sallentina]|uniref:HNH endonuclease n=1 Tax=Rhodopirellula sallentina TaxID=1263869 RepID=UPI0009DA5400
MSRYVPIELRRRVREAFGSCCAYCETAESLTVVTFEVEHIIPISRDGQSSFDNLCLACPACNRFKSDRTSGKLPDGTEVPLFHPQRDNWADHFDWTVDGTVIVGLTDSGKATVNLLKMNRNQVVRVRSLWVATGRHPPN